MKITSRDIGRIFYHKYYGLCILNCFSYYNYICGFATQNGLIDVIELKPYTDKFNLLVEQRVRPATKEEIDLYKVINL